VSVKGTCGRAIGPTGLIRNISAIVASTYGNLQQVNYTDRANS